MNMRTRYRKMEEALRHIIEGDLHPHCDPPVTHSSEECRCALKWAAEAADDCRDTLSRPVK